jgi:glutamyl-Q tRNA(Asp) synthetase
VALDDAGKKFGKHTLARPLEDAKAPAQLWNALRFLGQSPPAELAVGPLDALWSWARVNWNAGAIPRRRSSPAGNTT